MALLLSGPTWSGRRGGDFRGWFVIVAILFGIYLLFQFAPTAAAVGAGGLGLALFLWFAFRR